MHNMYVVSQSGNKISKTTALFNLNVYMFLHLNEVFYLNNLKVIDLKHSFFVLFIACCDYLHLHCKTKL